ncbi:MAG TPA: DUF6249 domain-containing protein [Opitutaceae bacterium]|jgi:hypothetical protein
MTSLHPILFTLAFYLPPITAITLGLAALVAIIVLHFQNKERARWHETARLAIEKGQSIPLPDPGSQADTRLNRHRKRMGLVIAGLVNLGIGIGLYFGISAIPGAEQGRIFVLIPAFIGAAFLIGVVIDAIFSPRNLDTSDDRPKL